VAEQVCRAATREDGQWVECGAPGVSLHRYGCIHEHVKEMWSCVLHEPEPGAVGCRDCFDAGHLCDLISQAVEA
jgi:hypothetical protein